MTLRYVIRALTVSVLLEFALIRIFSRTGVILPEGEIFFHTYNVLVTIGSIMFSFASLLAFLTLGLLAYLWLIRSSKLENTAATLAIGVLAASMLFFFWAPTAIVSIFYNSLFIMTVLVIILRFDLTSVNRYWKLAAALIFATYLCTYYYKVVPLASQISPIIPQRAYAVEAFNLGEGIAVFAASTLFLAFYKSQHECGQRAAVWKKGSLLTSSILTAVLLAGYLHNPWIASIITIWTLGFSLFLPFPLYAIAFWLFTYAVVALLTDGRREGHGLTLILLAGRTLQLSYFSLVAVIGLLLLTWETTNPKPHS